jgi:hypothetical protein
MVSYGIGTQAKCFFLYTIHTPTLHGVLVGYWCTLVVELLDFSQSEPMHKLPILSMGWAAFFSSSLNQSIFFGF